jgi:hypothetical protein
MRENYENPSKAAEGAMNFMQYNPGKDMMMSLSKAKKL